MLPTEHYDDNLSDLIGSLKLGWQQRSLSGLDPGRLVLLLPKSVSSNAERWLGEFKKIATTGFVERIDVVNSHQANDSVLFIQSRQFGIHSITDRSSFIHVFEESLRTLGGRVLAENASICLLDGNASSRAKRTGTLAPDAKLLENVNQAVVPSEENSTAVYEYDRTNVQDTLQSIFILLNDVQNQQEEYALDVGNGSVFPMDFVSLIHPVMNKLMEISHQFQPHALSRILQQLQSLYDQHLDQLREYFGKCYEDILDNQYATVSEIDMSNMKSIQDRILKNFRQAAENALVPMQLLLPMVQKFSMTIKLDYSKALFQMETDLNDATDLRKEPWDDEFGFTVADSVQQARRKRFLKFCKTLAKRAMMLGVNYAQGWIALQSIKRIAEAREQDMPKFPLF